MSDTNVLQFRRATEVGEHTAEEAQPAGVLTIDKLKQHFRYAEENLQEPRRLAFRDRDYYDNYDDDQWTSYEKKKLRQRNQQIATSNRIKGKVNATLFYVENAKSDPRAFPTRPGMEKGVQVATDTVDYIERNTNFDDVEWHCAFDLAWAGAEVVEVTLDERTQDVEIEQIAYERFFYDPRSCKKDFSDARYLGYCEWMDAEDAKGRYPGEEQQKIIDSSFDGLHSYDEGYEDKPYGVYAMRDQERVRVVVIYYRRPDGVWMLAHFTGAGILFQEESPWPDEHGNACGLIAHALYRNRDGKIFGQIRDWVSPQNEINQRKSKSLHLLSDRRTWGTPGWTPDEDKAKEGMARPDGHVEVSGPLGTNWGLLDSTAEIQGNFELLQQAVADIELGGQYTPGDRQRANDQSGIALQRLQMAGLSQDAPFFKAHRAWKLRVYRRMWFMARHFWTEPRSLPVVSGDEPRFVSLNEPVGMDPTTGAMMIRNPISRIDVDFIIEAAPETITLPQEEFAQLQEIAPALASLPPHVSLMLVEASNLRSKDKIIEFLQQAMQPAGPDPLEAAKVEADVRHKEAQTRKTDVETARIFADAQAGPEPKTGAA